MMSCELSNQLEAFSKQQQATCIRCQGAPFPKNASSCCECCDVVTLSRTARLDGLRISRVKADRGAGEESVRCVSFRQASSLGLVLVLLSSVLLDATVLFFVIGGALSTVSMAHELRLETLKQRQQHQELGQSMYDATLELKLAMREYERAEERLGFSTDFGLDDNGRIRVLKVSESLA